MFFNKLLEGEAGVIHDGANAIIDRHERLIAALPCIFGIAGVSSSLC